LFVVVIGLWLLAVIYFDPKILAYATAREPLVARLAILAFTVCLNYFWLYGIYHIVMAIFAVSLRPPSLLAPKDLRHVPNVAILYLTRNDFSKEALLSCLQQDYPAFDVYILDDSTDEAFQTAIDRFAAEQPVQPPVIRRKSHEGYKAGNLNHALEQIHERYELFAVTDADGMLPRDFLKRLVPYFAIDEALAFVQATQRVDPNQQELFARDFAFTTDVHWAYYPPVKMTFGFFIFAGHGAVIRSKVWKEVGGFPEIVCEDIAFTSRLRERGYYGVFASDVVCYEEFPRTYLHYLRRYERWIKGTMQYLLEYFPALLRSRHASWFEKLDIVLSASVLLNAVPFLVFVVLVGFVLPFTAKAFGLHIPLIAASTSSLAEAVQVYRLGLQYHVTWSLPFFLLMTITGFGQWVPIVLHTMRQPGKMFRCVAEFTFMCLATLPLYTIHQVTFLISRKTTFYTTGDVRVSHEAKRSLLFKLLPWVDLALAALLIWVVVTTANVWLLSVASALLIHPWLVRFSQVEWVASGMNVLIYVPFLLVLSTVLLIALSFW
jgi:cellulose synthase/poly-beta-1,6-N-acetylglucosamine synthase-like glycosyltransferase